MNPKFLTIDSQDRLYGTSSNFTVQLPLALRNVKRAKLLSCQIPNATYNIDTTNNILYFNDGTNKSVTIPPGCYTINNLPSTLTTLLNAASSIVFTISISQTTLFMTIAGTSPFQLLAGVNNIATTLGITVPSSVSSSITSSNIVDLSPIPYFYIDINGCNQDCRSCNTIDYGTFIVQNTTNSNDITYMMVNSHYEITESMLNLVNQINIKINPKNRHCRFIWGQCCVVFRIILLKVR